MRALRLREFRGFQDTSFQSLRRITLLVGPNSSGKSSFLRVLPLLRQSVETRSEAPIVWYSDQLDLVDFGSFGEVHRRGATAPLGLDFQVSISAAVSPARFRRPSPIASDLEVAVELSLVAAGEYTRPNCVALECGGLRGSVDIKENGEIGSVEMPFGTIDDGIRNSAYYMHRSPLIPLVSIQSSSIEQRLLKALRRIGHGRTTDETFEAIAQRLRFGTPVEVWESLRSAYPNSEYWDRQMRSWAGPKSAVVRQIRELLFARYFEWMLANVEMELTRVAHSTAYIKPFRAHPSRYYRVSDLAVDELDPVGGNLAMFVRSLTDAERRDFSSWMREYLDIELMVRKSGGHVVLQVRPGGGGEAFNLVDMGFGYSQVLPVLAQVWLGQRRKARSSRRRLRFLAIEQPELHLHPMHQAKLADVFAGAVRSARSLTIVAETHSKALVERLGELVYDGALSPSDVGILTFSKKGSDCVVEEAMFDDSGELHNWPPGFLSW